MKKITASFLLLILVLAGLGAQQHMPEMGMALRLNDRENRLFVNHPQHPFGTRLRVINLLNNTELELNVEGRPNTNTWALVEVSALAGEFLGVPGGVLNQVRIDVLAVPTATPAMRPRVGNINQTGNAVVQGSRSDLSAAHPSIAIGRRVELTNVSNGRSATITIAARCQASAGRIIEISPAAASALGISNSAQVRLRSID